MRSPPLHVALALVGPADEPGPTAHRLLRLLLATLTGLPPDAHVLERRCARCGGPHGKPVLVGSAWHPSLSYSSRAVAVAVTLAGPVGVDVEDVARVGAGLDGVALAPGERAVGDVERARTWTRKEALLKATGTGLDVDPRDVVVSAPGAPARLLAWAAAPGPLALYDVPAPAGHACSVAVLGVASAQVRVSDGTALLAAGGEAARAPRARS